MMMMMMIETVFILKLSGPNGVSVSPMFQMLPMIQVSGHHDFQTFSNIFVDTTAPLQLTSTGLIQPNTGGNALFLFEE